MCGPRISNSPTSLASHSLPSGLITFTSMWKSGLPTEPNLLLTNCSGSQKVLGPDSVMPYPALNSTPFAHHFSKTGGGQGAPPLATQRTFEQSKLSQRRCCCMATKIVGTPKK